MTNSQWWHEHYRERITTIIAQGRPCAPSAIKRNLGSGIDEAIVDAVIQNLISEGILRKSGRRYFPGKVHAREKPETAPALRAIVADEFEAKSSSEVSAIAQAARLNKTASCAAEKRRQRRTDQLMKRMNRP